MKHKNKSELSVSVIVAIIAAAGGIIAALIGIIPSSCQKESGGKSGINVETHSPNSPAVNAPGGQVQNGGEGNTQINNVQGDLNINNCLPPNIADELKRWIDKEKKEYVARNEKLEQLNKKLCRLYEGTKAELESLKDKEVGAADALKKYEQGDFKDAEKLFAQELSQGKERAASAAYYLGNIKSLKLDFEKAAEFYTKATQLSPNNTNYLNEAGLILSELGKYLNAIEYHQRALSIDQRVYGERHLYVAIDLNNLGIVWSDLGKYEKAIEFHEQALSIYKEVYGERHPDVADTLNNLGSDWYNLGKYEKAIEFFKQALSIKKEVYGESHPDVADALNNLGIAWKRLGKHDKAGPYILMAHQIYSDVLGNDHPKTKMVARNLSPDTFPFFSFQE